MKISTALLMVIFSVLLPTADVVSDIFFTLKLFTGFGHKERHSKYGAATLGPLLMSLMGQATHWFETETKEKRNKMTTFPLLIFQVYPQWRALKVIYHGKILKDEKWREMKDEFDGGISHLGKHDKWIRSQRAWM